MAVMVASVGPYWFSTRGPPSAWIEARCPRVRASPQVITSRSAGESDVRSAASPSAASIEGTADSSTVTWWRCIARTRATGSRASSGPTMTTVPPAASVPRRSRTEGSNEIDARFSTTSPARSPAGPHK
ncbi:hypothetical protein GCM10027456_32360 [Kineosporia babensis]